MKAPPQAPVDELRVSAYRVPTDAPEADGTLRWEATTLVLVELTGGGHSGLGYTYADASLVPLLGERLRVCVEGADALAIGEIGQRLWQGVRNLGRAGLAACAISAVDAALWDLKAKLLDQPLAVLLGLRRERVPLYGSGGVTSYDDERLARQLGDWVAEAGCRWVKMKVGTDSRRDAERVARARAAIGDAGLFIDANGAHSVRSAIAFARQVAEQQVAWFEEPVSSDDLAGLREVRAALGARRGGPGDGHCRRRIRLQPRRLSPFARAARGRCAAGRPDPLWRGQRFPAGGDPVRGSSPRPLGALRAGAAPACRLRRAAAAPSGMVPRSRASGKPVVRRRTAGGGRRHGPGPEPARSWPGIQAPGRAALRGVKRMY
nr:enolase C-terminal domain-like protein [uncultured Pseudomonas sp.]